MGLNYLRSLKEISRDNSVFENHELSHLRYLNDRGLLWPEEMFDLYLKSGGDREDILNEIREYLQENLSILSKLVSKKFWETFQKLVLEFKNQLDPDALLLEAISTQKVRFVRFVFEQFPEIDFDQGFQRAVDNGNLDIVRFFLNQGAIVRFSHYQMVAEKDDWKLFELLFECYSGQFIPVHLIREISNRTSWRFYNHPKQVCALLEDMLEPD